MGKQISKQYPVVSRNWMGGKYCGSSAMRVHMYVFIWVSRDWRYHDVRKGIWWQIEFPNARVQEMFCRLSRLNAPAKDNFYKNNLCCSFNHTKISSNDTHTSAQTNNRPTTKNTSSSSLLFSFHSILLACIEPVQGLYKWRVWRLVRQVD